MATYTTTTGSIFSDEDIAAGIIDLSNTTPPTGETVATGAWVPIGKTTQTIGDPSHWGAGTFSASAGTSIYKWTPLGTGLTKEDKATLAKDAADAANALDKANAALTAANNATTADAATAKAITSTLGASAGLPWGMILLAAGAIWIFFRWKG